MKTKPIFWKITAMNAIFVLLVSAVAIFLINACKKSEAQYPAINQITKQEAEKYISHSKNPCPINYFRVNMEQLRSMEEITSQRHDVKCFKFTPIDGGMIIQGIDTTGAIIDIPTFITGIADNGPCPYLCDEN